MRSGPPERRARKRDQVASTGVTISTPRKSDAAQMRSTCPNGASCDQANHAAPGSAPSSALSVPAASIARTKSSPSSGTRVSRTSATASAALPASSSTNSRACAGLPFSKAHSTSCPTVNAAPSPGHSR